MGCLLCVAYGEIGFAEPDSIRELRRWEEGKPKHAEDGPGPLFQALSPEVTGLDLVVPIDTSHPDKRLYYSAMPCGGMAVGDLDGDGWPELFFAAGPVSNRLYRHSGNAESLEFVDVTGSAGVGDEESWSTGAAMADLDGDGDLDLLVCRYDAPNRLFLNESTPGNLRFRDAAPEFGLDQQDASLSPVLADYDRDGDLDVFLVMNAYYRKGGRPEAGIPVRRKAEGWEVVAPWDRYYRINSIDPETGSMRYDECGRPNRLLRNEGGRFVDVSEAAGILPTASHSNAAVWWDMDGDGWLDLYVANDFSDRDTCYRNLGNGRFLEVAPETFQHTTWFSMGAAAEDYNNDGMTDLLVADMAPTTHYREKVTMGDMGASFDSMYRAGLPRQVMANAFFVNSGKGRFFEAAWQAGVARTDWTWGVKAGDLDCDGRLDLYFTTGHTRDFNHSDFSAIDPGRRVGNEDWSFFENRPELRERDLAFRNVGDWSFEAVEEGWGLGNDKTMTYAAAFADLDRDGDLDLVTHRLEDPPGVFLNRSRERAQGNALLLALRSRGGNGFGIGAKVTATLPGGGKVVRTLVTNNGYQESIEPLVHLGLGMAETVASLVVEWPSGTRQELGEVEGNRWLEIEEPRIASPKAVSDPSSVALPRFRDSTTLAGFASKERLFDDFARQPLLPRKHSQLGPGQCWGDVDGDGRIDLFLGGPRGQEGRLLLHRGIDAAGEPIFAWRRKEPFTRMQEWEDLGAIFFEADGDGDLDLLVVSGSVEGDPGDSQFEDRLYLNSGEGEFVEADQWRLSPKEGGEPEAPSGGPVAVADFDRDGDLDVYIGGRIVPGRFPLPARSQLLVNRGDGRFEDMAKAQGIEKTGMVSSALWSDADGDGWLDLILAHEWGAIRVFFNREGNLVEGSEAAGLDSFQGMWNSLAGGDFDNDGDIDYLAGNLGTNTKYRASSSKPEVLFYGDFEGRGTRRLVEAKVDPDTGELIPRRGLSCSTRAIPGLRNRIGTFHQWASASLGELYTQSRLEEAERFEVTTLESMLLINDGKGSFEVSPLPPLAQLAPVYGMALADFNGDGRLDAVLGQNFLPNQEETGPFDGGLGVLLEGQVVDGKPAFRECWPAESGLVLAGDVASIGVSDLNDDGWADLLVGVNQEAPRLLLHSGEAKTRPLVIELRGRKGNPSAIGARVRVRIPGVPDQVAEVSAGSGYLSQSSARLFLSWGREALIEAESPASEGKPAAPAAEVSVSWPDGSFSSHLLAPEKSPVYRIGIE